MPVQEAAEKVSEIAEAIGERTGLDKFENRVALLIAMLALFLSITSVAGSETDQAILQNEIGASDSWAFFQAKNIRRSQTMLARDQLELQVTLAGASWAPEARALAEEKLALYASEADRYKSEPGEGTAALMVRAREFEAKRDVAMKRDPNFDFAEGILEIAIVIASVSIILKKKALFRGAVAIGAVGGLLTINGFLMLVSL